MTALMDARRRVLILMRPATHRDLKVEAARAEVEMSDLADIAISHVAALLSEGKAPQAVAAAIKKARKKKKDGGSDAPSDPK
jgi:hypothetical protein